MNAVKSNKFKHISGSMPAPGSLRTRPADTGLYRDLILEDYRLP